MPPTAILRAHVESALGEHLSSTLLLRERACAADGVDRSGSRSTR